MSRNNDKTGCWKIAFTLAFWQAQTKLRRKSECH